MTSVQYIGLDVHKETISIAVMNSAGKLLMESIIETKASTILQFIAGLRGDLRLTFEEGPGPPGYTICSNPTSANSWFVIRERMLCSKTGTRAIGSMPAS